MIVISPAQSEAIGIRDALHPCLTIEADMLTESLIVGARLTSLADGWLAITEANRADATWDSADTTRPIWRRREFHVAVSVDFVVVRHYVYGDLSDHAVIIAPFYIGIALIYRRRTAGSAVSRLAVNHTTRPCRSEDV